MSRSMKSESLTGVAGRVGWSWVEHPGRGRLRRPQQRARHLGRLGRQRARRARPGQVRGRAGRHHPGRAVAAHRRRPGGLRSPAAPCPRSRRAPRSCCRRPDRRRRWWRWSPVPPSRCCARSTSCSPCCTGASARTAPSRGCSRWPASPTSGRACSRAPRRMDKESPRSCCAPRGSTSAASRWCAAAVPARRADLTTSACRCSSTGPGRFQRRHHQGRPTGPMLADARRARRSRTTTRCSSRRQ